MAAALVTRRPSALPVGLAGVGAAYGLFLSLRTGAVDPRAPAVATALFVAAELGFWGLRAVNRACASGRFSSAASPGSPAGALLTALVGSLVLGLTTGVGGGVALEAAGVAAATLTVAAIALLASRSSV